MAQKQKENMVFHPSDAALVSAALKEEPGAFEVLVGRYKSLLSMVAYRQVGDLEESEDVAQEAFVRAFISLASLEMPTKFKPWITRITRNIALDHLRRRKRRAMSIEDSRFDEAHILGHDTAGVSREMMATESRLQILDAISQLPEDYEIPVLMRYVEGLSYKDISKRLGVREDTLRKRVHRANCLLREKLKHIINHDD